MIRRCDTCVPSVATQSSAGSARATECRGFPWAPTALGERIGSWRVASLLGAGGMGRVYKAVQPEIGRTWSVSIGKWSEQIIDDCP